MRLLTYFPSWYNSSINQTAPEWQHIIRSADDLMTLSEKMLDAEMEIVWGNGLDGVSLVCAKIIEDVILLEESSDQLIMFYGRYLRLSVSNIAMKCSNMHGRFGLSFDWIICATAEGLTLRHFEPGKGVYIDSHLDIFAFLNYPIPTLYRMARLEVSKWLAEAYYYGRRHGGHRQLLNSLYKEATKFAEEGLVSANGEEFCRIALAAAQIAPWGDANNKDVTAMVNSLQIAFRRGGIPKTYKRAIGMALGTSAGTHTEKGVAYWAKKALKELNGVLIAQDILQLTVNAIVSDEVNSAYLVDRIEKLITSYVNKQIIACKHDTVIFNYQQIRLYDIISPYITTLAKKGKADDIISVLTQWFLVPNENKRKTNLICFAPNDVDGALYASNGMTMIVQNTEVSYSDTIAATNEFLGIYISIFDNPSQEDFTPSTLPAQDVEAGNVFLKQLLGLYKFKEACSFFAKNSNEKLSLLPLSTLPHPVQPLMVRECGFSFPICSSYEAPQIDRPVKKALLFNTSTLSGQAEVEAAADFLSANGIEVTLHSSADFTNDEFLSCYLDPSYDLLWITSHGDFMANDPHLSNFHLTNSQDSITLAEIMSSKELESDGRRLLFLNFCFGGASQIISAPPRYGIAAILAASNQAVISHLWPVSLLSGPVFGSLVAIGLTSQDSFFGAFEYAVKMMQKDREEIVSLLDSTSHFNEISRMIRNSSSNLSPISSWGSPVFFE